MNDTRVGVVGEPSETIVQAVDNTSATLVEDPFSDPTFVIAVGEAALYSLIPDAPAPVLPVETGTPGLNPVSRENVPEVLSNLLDEPQLHSRIQSQPQPQSQSQSQPQTHTRSRFSSRSQLTVTHPVIGIDRPDGMVYALIDVLLLTSEQARISEYTVMTGDEPIASIRADGIVVATPAGSHGYAHDAGGPYIAPETAVGSVVPIAPFSVTHNHWVLSLSDIRLTIERDDAAVELLVDGRSVGTVPYTDTLRLEPVSAIETIRTNK